MKRLYTILLSIILSLSLVACNGENTDNREARDDGDVSEDMQENSGRGNKTRIAEELKPEDYEKVPTAKTVPDFGLFMGLRGSEAIEYGKTGTQDIDLESDKDLQWVLEYIELLQSEEFGFEIVGSQNYNPEENDPFGGKFYGGSWEIAFASTKINGGREQKSALSKTECDVYIYEAKKTLYIHYTSVFDMVDCGHRYSGYEGDRLGEIVGERATEAYSLKKDKYYNEGDEKLSVSGGVRTEREWIQDGTAYAAYQGQSKVIVNGGEVQSGTGFVGKIWTKAEKSKSKVDCYSILLEEFLSKEAGEQLKLYLPLDIQVGEVLRMTDFLSGHQKDAERVCYLLAYTPDYTYSAIYATQQMKLSGCIEACTVRVLQWDPTGESDCVLYISAEGWVDAEPFTVEAIVAAPVNDVDKLKTMKEKEESERSSSGSYSFDDDDGPYIPDYAKLDCLTCGGDGDCNTCGGYGEVDSYMGAGESIKTKCKSCYGSGDCRTCGGSGTR